MSEARPPSIDLLPLSQTWQVDQVCHRFEHAWATSGRPAIEDFLADTLEPQRSALLGELISIDIHYRRLAGDEPQPADYQQRFGMLEATWPARELANRQGEPSTEPPAQMPNSPGPLTTHHSPTGINPCVSTRKVRWAKFSWPAMKSCTARWR
jgi:hypothetical protein